MPKFLLSDVLSSASSIMIGQSRVISVGRIPTTPYHALLKTLHNGEETSYFVAHQEEVEIVDGKVTVKATKVSPEMDVMITLDLFIDRPMTAEDVVRG